MKKDDDTDLTSIAGTDATTISSTFSATPSVSRHILLVTETWSPDVNGVAMSLGQLMRELIEMGHRVSLLRPTPKAGVTPTLPTLSEVLTADIQVTGVPIPRYSDMQFGVPAYFKIKSTLKQCRPDLVHIATEGPLGLASLIASKRLGIPATTGYHTQFHDFSKHFGFGFIAKPLMAYFRWMHNASKATCVPSQKTKNSLKALGFKRLYIVGRGVDAEQFSPAKRSDELRQTWGANGHHTVLVMVSRLSPEKGVDLVIKGFKKLQQTQLHRATKLVIVGDGPDRSRLESLASDCSEDVIFAGAQSGEDLAQHYASGDAFVFGSQVETFGNVVVEAMASGLPVFAFDDASAGMLVTPECGGLAEVGNGQAFVDLIANLPKMQVLSEQGEVASEKVKEFSWRQPAEQMFAMFEQAIDSKGADAQRRQSNPSSVKNINATQNPMST